MNKHRTLDSRVLPVPILPCGTGGLVSWAFAGKNERPDFRTPGTHDAVYCIDAPAYIPSGALSFDGNSSYLERT